MVDSKITDERILKVFNSISEKEVKDALLSDNYGLCSAKLMREHEKAFRGVIPAYFDDYISIYRSHLNDDDIWLDRKTFMVYVCLQYGVVDPNDFATVANFAGAGINVTYSWPTYAPDSADTFKDCIMRLKDGDEKLIEFLDKNPIYLRYFLPLMCSMQNEKFSRALNGYVQSAGLEDTMRIDVFKEMLQSSDAKALLGFLDDIDGNNYHRFKALNEAIHSVFWCSALASKEIVSILRDAANCNFEKYLTADFRRTYNFAVTYKRLYKDEFKTFAFEVIKSGGDRARYALLYLLDAKDINGEYAKEIFSRKLTLEELSFFDNKVGGDMDVSAIPIAFENLFGILTAMDKINYHFKVDDDVTFAREVSKATIVSALGDIAVKSDNAEYIKRLDGIYDTLKEEAQACYLKTVGDKTGLDTRLCAIKFLKTDNYCAQKYFDGKNIKLDYQEAVMVSDYLKSKKEYIKSNIIKLYLGSKDCDKITQYLLSCKEDFKKAVGEEMQKSSGKVDGKKLEKKTQRFYWGDECVFIVEKPDDEISKLAKRQIGVKPLKSISHKRVKDFFEAIKDFIQVHKDYEYQSDYSEGLAQFGSSFNRLKGAERGSRFDAYPLGEEIRDLIKDNFTQEEIAGIIALVTCVENKFSKKTYSAICGNKPFGDPDKNYDYVKSLDKGYWADTNEYRIVCSLDMSIAEELLSQELWLASIAAFTQEKALNEYKDKDDLDDEDDEDDEEDMSYKYPLFYGNFAVEASDDIEVLEILLHYNCILIEAGVKEGVSLDLVIKAYEYGLISQELARYSILKHGYIGEQFEPDSEFYVLRENYKYPKFKALIIDFVDNALEIEFNRGSLETPYSNLLARTHRLLGMEKFFKAIVALRGLTWQRSPFGTAKDDLLSHILKCCVKAQDDNYEKFVEFVKKYDITDDELVKSTLFNPEFVDYTAKYLDVHNLKLAVFWFIAHLNENLYGDKQEKRIEQIKEFSDVSYPDFKDGAFDFKWYEEMVQKVPERVLEKVYDNAKYVTVGGLHKRAQRFFDAVNGRIDKAECKDKINSTRNKDYCLIYSLIPIESREDLRERYTALAEFVRSGKQFGAQRQLSERRTVDIAMENLARVAGYASSDIFIFEMEAENPSEIFKTFAIDDIAITPYIDESKFKVTYRVEKNGKTINSIPSKYGKNSTVVAIREEIKRLNQKFRRIIVSLESTMNNRVEFTLDQLNRMRKESVMASVLDKLVFLADGRLCVFDKDFKSIDGKSVEPKNIYVAHPVELKKSGLLQSAIEYVAKNNIRQPFKQALREIYVKTDSELEQDEVLRFRGFEVDLKKCIAALKGKGWGVSEDIGLRKVYYRSDTVAAIFREFDLFYTADFANENRELHGIFFLKRKSGEIMPIKDVEDITFSETLRDVDLMISISSKVIYDFDLAMSTVEMRQEVLKSIVSILGLNNVSFLKDNIKVEGKLGTYVINIRTGLVFKEGKGNLALDTVYSVDKPILLDFVDEDPMTADIISKAVVLSSDDKVRDPAILREIKD